MGLEEQETASIYVRGEAGTIIMMDLPLPENIVERLAKGTLRQVNEDGSPFVDDAVEGVPTPPTEAPARSAAKAKWVAWAVVRGATVDDADAMTKEDLIELYGG